MKSTLLEGPRRRLPLRNCGLCGKSDDVLHLARVGRTRICTDCYKSQVARSTTRQAQEDSESLILLRRIDSLFRYGSVVIRLVFYTGLYQLAKHSGFYSDVLTGFLLGDGITWAASAWFDRRFHSLAVLVEIILYTGAIALWVHLTGGFHLPEDPAAKGVVFLIFFATFSAKGSWKAWRLLHREPD